MRTLLKGLAIVAAFAGSVVATTALSSADGFSISTSDRGRNHTQTGITLSFGDVAFGYNDGYWDNGHRWHKWRNRGDHDNYRNQHGDNYRSGNHSHYKGQGWRRN